MLKNYSWPTSGVISNAVWKRSERQGPYISLEVEVEPFWFGGREIAKIYKSLIAVMPLLPGQLHPFKQLERAIGDTIDVELPIEENKVIPSLIGHRLSFGLTSEEFEGIDRIRIDKLIPREGGKELHKVGTLGVGVAFRRPKGKIRYVTSNITRPEGFLPRSAEIFCYNMDNPNSNGGWFKVNEEVCKVPMQELTGEVDPDTTEDYWMCHVQGQDFPRIMHFAEKDGRSECERLARKSHKRVFLLGTIAYVDYTPPGDAEIKWTELDC